MSFSNQVVVVIGATGYVGSGVVRKYLDSGAQVVAVSRSAANLDKLKQTIAVQSSEPFLSVVGDFKDEASAQAAHAAVSAALGGKEIDHLVSVQGFAAVTKPPTDTTFDTVKDAMADGLYNNFLAAKVFLPQLKDREGASFTIVTGGLAHIPPPNPAVWLGSVKNAALIGLTNSLSSETSKNKVRVNAICIHFGVGPIGGELKNQFGMPAEGDSRRLAPAFLAVARGTQKGQIICLKSFADAEKYGE